MSPDAPTRIETHEKPDFPISIYHNRGSGDGVLGIHCHGDFEILQVTRGEAVFRIGPDSYPCRQGDILFVNPYEFHSAATTPDQTVEYVAIVYERNLLESITLHPDYNRFIRPLLENRLRFPHRIAPESRLEGQVQSLLVEILEEYEKKPVGHEWMIRTCLEKMVVLLYRQAPSDGSGGRLTAQQRLGWDFADLFRLIAEQPSRHMSTRDAAAQVRMSPYHFCRRFKEYAGRTFVDFLNLYRVNEAERLLRDTTLTITEIAEQVGFCNIHYFDRVFRAYKKRAPSSMRISRAGD